MSPAKAQGFVRGDFDPAFPLDDKVQRLRAATDARGYHAAMSVYWHVVAAAWRRPERKPALNTCPDMPEEIALLSSVGLLDKAGRLPVSAFNAWIGRAMASRVSSTERKRRSRTGMSRVTDSDSASVREALGREGAEGRVGTEYEGGPGGDRSGLLVVPAAVCATWEQATGRSVFACPARAQEILVDSAQRHPERRVTEAIREARSEFEHIPEANVLAFRVRNLLDPLPSGKESQAAAAAKREATRSRRAVENTIRNAHETGFHGDTPDPRCALCKSADQQTGGTDQ